MASRPRELVQTFRFAAATGEEIARVLAESPLLGEGGIFGRRSGLATGSGHTREIVGFEPLPFPLIRFDVAMKQRRLDDGVQVLVEFSQPRRGRPYLEGQFVWLLRDEGDEAVLQEEINTPAALAIVDRPLHGQGRSLRRRLFFAGGHERLMGEVAANLQRLLDETRAGSPNP